MAWTNGEWKDQAIGFGHDGYVLDDSTGFRTKTTHENDFSYDETGFALGKSGAGSPDEAAEPVPKESGNGAVWASSVAYGRVRFG